MTPLQDGRRGDIPTTGPDVRDPPQNYDKVNKHKSMKALIGLAIMIALGFLFHEIRVYTRSQSAQPAATEQNAPPAR